VSDMSEYKVCSYCGVKKSVNDFYKSKWAKDGKLSRCKECINEYQRKRYRDGLEKPREKRAPEVGRDIHLRSTFGISSDEYEQMFIEQDGRCAICRRSQLQFKYRFAVDHDHKTGKVRGLLCVTCNSYLGMIDDSIEVLETAIKYLEKP
jgi:hypothetical protein